MPTVVFLEALCIYSIAARSSSDMNLDFFNLSDFDAIFKLLKYAENVGK